MTGSRRVVMNAISPPPLRSSIILLGILMAAAPSPTACFRLGATSLSRPPLSQDRAAATDHQKFSTAAVPPANNGRPRWANLEMPRLCPAGGFGPPTSARVLRIRGGAAARTTHSRSSIFGSESDTDSSDSDSEETDGDEEPGEDADAEAVPVDAEVVDGPWANAAASAATLQRSADDSDNEQQGRSYFLAAVLWSSLVLDCVLNKSKRALLFAGASGGRGGAVAPFDGSMTLATLAPTAILVSGYALAAGVAYLLSRELTEEGGTVGGGGGFGTEVRRRLALCLAVFGAGNLAASAGSGPYLGLSGAVINGHNALVAINGWTKDVARDREGDGGSEKPVGALIRGTRGTLGIIAEGSGIFRPTSSKGERLKRTSSAVFLLATFSAVIRAVQSARTISSGTPMSVMVAAGLARFALASGVTLTLKEASDKGRLGDSTVVGLCGLASICSLGVAMPLMIANVGMRKVTSEAGKLLFFSLFSGAIGLSQLFKKR